MRLSVRIRLSGRHGKVRLTHPTISEPAHRGPREHVLLIGTLAPEPTCRAALTAKIMVSQYDASRRVGTLPPQPDPEPFADIPVYAGKDTPGPGAVAVVVRPPTQDWVDLLELFAKAAPAV